MRNIVIRIGLISAVGIGAFILRPYMTGGAGELKVGECFDVPSSAQTVEEVQHHPCTEAHIGEVFFVGKLPGAENAPTRPTPPWNKPWRVCACPRSTPTRA